MKPLDGIFGGAYRGKRVLVTGHTGFKGGWLSLWLHELGAEVHGLALPAAPGSNFHGLIQSGTFRQEFTADVGDAAAVQSAVAQIRPEFVFHLAAQPLVRRSYVAPVETVQTNVLGTVNLLESVRQSELSCPVLVVTTDKCYQNHDWLHGYRETDPLGGHDVYSASKAACELVVAAWRKSFFEPNPKLGPVVTARGGNVIGGGDFAADRLVPDCIRSLAAGETIRVRNPKSTRPWQHVLDCLSGYLWYGASLTGPGAKPGLARALNFGPLIRDNRDVQSLVAALLQHWPGKWLDASDPLAPHEAGRLHLATDLAAAQLGWQPTWGFDMTVQQTAEWYLNFHQHGPRGMRQLSLRQIDDFVAAAAKAGQPWAGGEAK